MVILGAVRSAIPSLLAAALSAAEPIVLAPPGHEPTAVCAFADGWAVALSGPSGAAGPDAWTYGAASLRLHAADGTERARRDLPAGHLLPTTLLAHGDRLLLGAYVAPALVATLGDRPGLRRHDPAFPQRASTPSIPPEHRDEPKVDRALDQRGAPAVLAFAGDLALTAAATLEGWQSAWFVPGAVRATWRQPVLLAAGDGGDVLVVHDGGLNRLPAAGRAPDFADYCLAVDHVSRLSADLATRRWRSELTGPPVDAAAITASLHAGPHFAGTRATEWTAPVLGNPRAMAAAPDGRGGLWVAGCASSRTAAEPWWCPFVRRVGADGGVRDGPYTPSPTAGDGRLHGLVSDTAAWALAPLPDGDLAIALLADGGNTIARQDPTDPFRESTGWRGQPAPFRGRLLFWGGVARLDRDLQLRWGLHLGGAGADRRGRPTQLACWAERLAALPDGRLIATGRIAAGARCGDAVATADSALLVIITADGAHERARILPGERITGLAVRGDQAALVGHGPAGAWLRLVDTTAP